MDSLKLIRVKFKLENQVLEEELSANWSIGKIKGKVRKLFKINPYYILEFIYNGQVLQNQIKFENINYLPESTIKILASRPAEI